MHLRKRKPALSGKVQSSVDIFPPKVGDIGQCRNCGYEHAVLAESTEKGLFGVGVHSEMNFLTRLFHPEQEFTLKGHRLLGKCPWCRATILTRSVTPKIVRIDIFPRYFCKFHRRRKKHETKEVRDHVEWMRFSLESAHREPFLIVNAEENFVIGIIQHEYLDENFIRHYSNMLQPLLDCRHGLVILDLGILQMLGGASESVFVSLFVKLKKQGRELRIACAHEQVLKKIRLNKLLSFFNCYVSLKDAVGDRRRIQ